MTSATLFRPTWRPAVLAAAMCVLAGVPAWAQQSSATVATVDGSPITEADVSATSVDLEAALQQYPPESHGEVVLDFLVNQKLMAAAAKKEGIEETPAFAHRMTLVRERELRDAYFETAVRDGIGEEEIKEAYAKIEEQAAQDMEIHARHILVETEDAAKAIIEGLKGGADFAELAKEKSTGPSGPNGGDLGFFGRAGMAPAIYEAALALEPGEISAPVNTEFGWHVVKVEEKRPGTPPPLEQLREQIVEFLVRQKFLELITELKAAAEIDIVGQPQQDGEGQAQEPPATQEAQ